MSESEWLVSESEWEPEESLPIRGGLTSSIKSPLSSKRRPHFKTLRSLERTKIWSRVLTGPETKNDSAGEGEQEFTGLKLLKG
jgi:hypothetical protein